MAKRPVLGEHYELQVEQTAKGRTNAGQSMPVPVHGKEELSKINEMAVRNKDGQLLRYVYEQKKDKLLANPTPDALSRLKGFAVMADMEMRRGQNDWQAPFSSVSSVIFHLRILGGSIMPKALGKYLLEVRLKLSSDISPTAWSRKGTKGTRRYAKTTARQGSRAIRQGK